MNSNNPYILAQFNWTYKKTETKNSPLNLSELQRKKISKLPKPLIDLILHSELLSNRNDTAWFVTYDILKEKHSDLYFSWNEFEKESLNSAMYPKDAERINTFWDTHFCFIMSVKSGYSHISIVTDGNKKGQIIWGEEPEYEDVNFLAQTYDEFFSMLVKHVNGTEKNEILNIIL
ncbi:hypothetical protein [Escherichia albertii]|uniref:hypothetical protein n=1 Tax=Escherichia albertii TaxID=208962 RepID=UPI0030C9B48C